MAIEVQGLEIQIGARTLLHPTNFHVAKGDKIGLVGRNGAGKTTLTRVITGDMLPTAGKVRVSGKLGYLPQDTHASDPTQTALDRMMSARDIATIINRIRKAEKDMTDPDPDVMSKAMTRYDKAMQDFDKAGGYAAQSEAISMAASLGLPQEVMEQQLGTLSGGQRRRIELARILFSNADTLILDEPTNHLDADSIEWLRGYLKKYEGGFLVISHSTELLDEVVNKVWHLDAQLGQIDMYSLGWKAYLHQRVVDEERRRREREVAEKKADRLMKQGIRLHAKATKAVAAQNMMRRAEKLLENTSEAQKAEKVADIRFPEPAPCGRTPIMAKDISKAYGSNIVFAGVNLAIDKGSRVVILGYNGAGKTTTLRLLARDAASIRAQGELLLPHVAPHYPDFDVRLEACQSQIGSGSLPVDRLPSAALTFTPRDGRGSQLDALSARWRALPAPVIGRIYDGRMWLDLRCLEDEARFLEMLLK